MIVLGRITGKNNSDSDSYSTMTSAINLAFHSYFVIALTHFLHPTKLTFTKVAFVVYREKDSHGRQSIFLFIYLI